MISSAIFSPRLLKPGRFPPRRIGAGSLPERARRVKTLVERLWTAAVSRPPGMTIRPSFKGYEQILRVDLVAGLDQH
ncbi:hypothetical protein, partial [Mesorhizobium sp.]|uniref:hypothetical protein n=1 Tax=Mesorhizobium sp. TaxID=1871066 RepID=UPI0025F030B6